MKENFRVFFRWIPILFIGIAIGLTIKATLAWVEPDQMPPGGNIAAPLNTGNAGQIKTGGLILNTGGATLGLIVERGLVGIGTNNPQATLDVNGNIKANNIEVTGKINAQEISINGVPLSSLMPSGMIAYFDLTTCPTGWSEVPSAKGRYLVGTQNSANKNLTVGQALGDGENRPVGQHAHGVYDPGHTHGVYDPGHAHGVYDPGHTHGFPGLGCNGYSPWNCNSIVIDANGLNNLPNSLDKRGVGIGIYGSGSNIGIYGSGTGIGINNAGSAPGTNAPYIEFLTCRKN